MKKFFGLMLIAFLFAGDASADQITLDLRLGGNVVNRHFDGSNLSSTVVGHVSGSESLLLSLPTGPLTEEHLSHEYANWEHAFWSFGFSAFVDNSPDSVTQPFASLLAGYSPSEFSTPQGRAVLAAVNWYKDYDSLGEYEGGVDGGGNYISFNFTRWEVIDHSMDDFGTSTMTMYQTFDFLIPLADGPTSGADVELRTADDVRALFSGLDDEIGYFYSFVGVDHERCERGSCWGAGYDYWHIDGQISASALPPTGVPVPATVVLLALGLPLLRRHRG